MTCLRRFITHSGGVSAIEFAFVAPALILVLAGIVTGWKKKGKKATVVLDVGAEIRPASKNQDECIAHLHAEPDRLTRTGDPVDMCECGGLPKARCASRQFPYLRGGSDWTCPASLTGGGNG